LFVSFYFEQKRTRKCADKMSLALLQELFNFIPWTSAKSFCVCFFILFSDAKLFVVKIFFEGVNLCFANLCWKHSFLKSHSFYFPFQNWGRSSILGFNQNQYLYCWSPHRLTLMYFLKYLFFNKFLSFSEKHFSMLTTYHEG